MEEKKLLGKPVAEKINSMVGEKVNFLKSKGIEPKLSVVLVGNDPASSVYVGMKEKACIQLGIHSKTYRLPENTSEKDLLDLVQQLNQDAKNHGILVQLPLPKHINEDKIINTINVKKDVDCFHPENVGRIVAGNPYVLPCTPAGIVEILKYYKIETSGSHTVIIGRSNIVGKPMANILMQKAEYANATVTVTHSRTKNISSYTKQADILIAAMGKAKFVTSDMVKEGVVVIDVGINRIDADNEKGYALVGDVDYENVAPKASFITPVPGGVGPMTIAMLMSNTALAAATQNGIKLE
ncbi:MAG: bifunctional 5,10-methylene-tetrahydrofolate dehydrogenase/5,10-methylene-tetrahydrofolate cyclohydrolase [Calditrichaceae bacterium]|nr:bifunctional 5,10-methylene-tetrahydrofolate dehydrogenase/5,10-methylene-tetrahydrofolate cyclohydrolase [Calditrichaceae bacterium]MBN2709868.1 bifunctional 5,10-methylene-tetrahydrofolate dehydrogenase/5,10-methylene-tetrahydrofolate cyclohydrolase [Calditrichaceae bacterium]RQV92625.1 MAG: bifunctional 5,10-methylene-tetrahydrofolate dehydrogenase/5,10-methylene-tetrahydrofolate cyclohydrolase [Calditrichota bacterium]